MATYTIYSGTEDGQIQYDHATSWANAKDGTGGTATVGNTGTVAYAGQAGPGATGSAWRILQSFFRFDTSAIPDSDVVIGAVFSAEVSAAFYTNLKPNFQLASYNWGSTVDSADWRNSSAISGLTRLAELDWTNRTPNSGTRYSFQNINAGLRSVVNKTGFTNLILFDKKPYIDGTQVDSGEYSLVSFKTAEETGTTSDPRLVITTYDSSGYLFNVFSEGDSNTVGYTANDNSFAVQAKASLSGGLQDPIWFNGAVSGKQAKNPATGQFTGGSALDTPSVYNRDAWFITGGANIYSVMIGTVDALDSSNMSASTIYDNIKAVWASARTEGWKVIAHTLPYTTNLTQARIDDINTLIESNPSLYDALVDVNAAYTYGNTAASTTDGLHLTEATHAIIAAWEEDAWLSLAPPMPILLRSSSFAIDTTTGTSFSCNVPAGTQDGDILIAAVFCNSSSASIVAPDGWTLIRDVHGALMSATLAVFWKRASSESGSYTFTGLTGGRTRIGIGAFVGCVETGDPIDNSAETEWANGGSKDVTSFNTSVDNAALVWSGAVDQALPSTMSWTPPTDFSEFVDTATDSALAMAYKLQDTAGATGTITGTPTVTDKGAAIVVALKPQPIPTQYIQNLSGSVSSSSSLVRQARKTAAGTVASASSVSKRTARIVTAGQTSSGSLSRRLNRRFLGGASLSGLLIRFISRRLTGSSSPTGVVAKSLARRLTGSSSPTGVAARSLSRRLTGGVASGSSLTRTKLTLKSLSGSVTPSGTLSRRTHKPLASSVTSGGVLRRNLSRRLLGGVAIAGVAVKRLIEELAGLVASVGAIPAPRYIFPTGDVSPGGWSSTEPTLAGAVSDASDSTYIYSSANPVNDEVVLQLQATGTPPAGPISIIIRGFRV